MNSRSVVAAVAVVATLVALTSGQVSRCFPREKVEPAGAEFPARVENFGLSLFRELSRAKRGNIFVSPYSVWSALTLAYFGAEGETRRQLEFALNMKGKIHTYFGWGGLRLLLLRKSSNGGAILSTLNRAYISDSVNLNSCIDSIVHDIELMDFSRPRIAVDKINGDVSKATEGRITNLIDNILPTSKFVLINTVFFKGVWESQFNPNDTRTQEFLVSRTKSAGTIEMMTQMGMFNHGPAPSLGASILELPYAKSNVSMFLLLPTNISTESITSNLTNDNLREAMDSMTTKNVFVGLPQFNMTTRLAGELKDGLKRMGVFDLFVPGRANMTAFSRDVPLNANEVIHQAAVEVNHEGTVAAAATAVINTRLGIGSASFVCNRPFVFLIYNKLTATTLFIGRYSKPA